MQKRKIEEKPSESAIIPAETDEAPADARDAVDALIPATPQEQSALEGILQIFIKSARVDFSHYRQTTVLRRITRRISLHNLDGFTAYLALLEKRPDEVELLYDDLLLSHTEFFRDPAVFDELKKTVFPVLATQRPVKTPIRVWVAGCSTGEEVYSLAICLHEFLVSEKSGATAQFFGTDLNLRHITAARKGLYPDKIRKTISAERLARYFDQTPEGLMVTKQIREMCVFAVQDVTQDPPFPSIDLVSCRNVLIYFDAALQDVVIPLFHFALKPAGYLLLGSSESMGKFTELFSPLNQNINLYSRRLSRKSPAYRFPVSHLSWKQQAERGQLLPNLSSKQRAGCTDMGREIDSILLAAFAPPCVLVDCNMQIRLFRGDTSPCLAPVPGEASLKLSRMTGEGLMPDIYVAVEDAKKKKGRITRRNVTFRRGETAAAVDLSVVPIPDPASGEPCYLIIFEKPPVSLPPAPGSTDAGGGVDARHLLLTEELRETKEHLQSIIEEKDEVNQEMWAANEEIQSTNEELQSVNEEMEAAKEELEASNEELVTLNEEMRVKNVQLRESEEKFRSIVDSSPMGMHLYELKPDDRLVFTGANQAANSILGVDNAIFIGKTIEEAFPPLADTEVPTRYRAVARSGVSWHTEQVDYDDRKIRGAFHVVAFKTGESTMAAMFLDITERKRAEEALRERTQFAESLINLSPDILYIYDIVERKNVYANDGIQKVLGYTVQEVKDLGPQLISSLMHPDDFKVYQAETLPKYAKAVDNQQLIAEFRMKHKDGGWRWLICNEIIYQRASDGSPRQIFGMIHDLTEIKKAQEALQTTQKLESLGVLAGGIAHDFNNLLGGIFGYIDLAHEEPDRGMASQYLGSALATIDRARNLTAQLLTFAKGGAPIQKVTLLFPFIRETVQFALSGSRVSSRFDHPADLWACRIDKHQIGQAIDNMTINALQAMPDGGTIDVTARNVTVEGGAHPVLSGGRYVKISIRDTGTGIAAEVLPRIFDPFYTTKAKGHGLGLATSYSIIMRHGGAIDVESEPGKGTTFHIHLPASLEIPVDEDAASSRHKGTGTVIVMDDEEVIRDTIKNMLQSFGYSVICGNNGGEALKAFIREADAGRDVTALILDLTVPGAMGGKEAVREIRKLDGTVPVFVASGYADDPVMKNPLEYGFTASICKPFRKIELGEMLERYLRTGRSLLK